jgi:mono/diheme cytochrome c family protein
MAKSISIVLLSALWLIACSNGPGTENVGASVAVEDPKPDGKKIYKINCVTCHGLYGDMQGSGAFDLTSSELSLEERILVITNGRNTMMPFNKLLDPEEIEAVAAYTLELKKTD